MVESECCVFKVSPTDPSAMAIRNVPPRLGVPACACLVIMDAPRAPDIPRAVEPIKNSRRLISAVSGTDSLPLFPFSFIVCFSSKNVTSRNRETELVRCDESSGRVPMESGSHPRKPDSYCIGSQMRLNYKLSVYQWLRCKSTFLKSTLIASHYIVQTGSCFAASRHPITEARKLAMPRHRSWKCR